MPFSHFRNVLAQCYDGRGKTLNHADIDKLIIHRTDLETRTEANPSPIPNDYLNGFSLAWRFHNSGLGTGGRIPYHFLIRTDGIADQMLPLFVRGTHTKGANWCSIGIAVVGDFQENPIPLKQYETLILLCCDLVVLNNGCDIVGHTNIPGGSADPSKVCPGKGLNVGKLELDVVERVTPATFALPEIEARLDALGYILR